MIKQIHEQQPRLVKGDAVPGRPRRMRAKLPERLAEGSGITRLPHFACCNSVVGLQVHPRMDAIQVCTECLERETEPFDYIELGWGD